jgi:hypothetical protein
LVETEDSKEVYKLAVGDIVSNDIFINEVKIPAIIDTGSQITSMTYSCYLKYFSDVEIVKNSSFIKLESASEDTIPFIGFIVVDIKFLNKGIGSKAIIIVNDPKSVNSKQLRDKYPVLAGTNMLDSYLCELKFIEK